MAGSLPSEHAARLAQHRKHVAVTDRGTAEFGAGGGQRNLHTQIAHHGTDHRSTQNARLLQRACDDVQQPVPVDDAPHMIDHDHAARSASMRSSSSSERLPPDASKNLMPLSS